MFVVYRHTNVLNGKSYIGWTSKTIGQRWSKHLYDAFREKTKYYFHRAIKKHGMHIWKHVVLAELKTCAAAKLAEEQWVELFESNDPEHGYNMTSGGESSIPNAETRRRMSKSMCAAWKDSTNRENWSRARRGLPKSAEHRRKLGLARPSLQKHEQSYLHMQETGRLHQSSHDRKCPRVDQASEMACLATWEKTIRILERNDPLPLVKRCELLLLQEKNESAS